MMDRPKLLLQFPEGTELMSCNSEGGDDLKQKWLPESNSKNENSVDICCSKGGFTDGVQPVKMLLSVIYGAHLLLHAV